LTRNTATISPRVELKSPTSTVRPAEVPTPATFPVAETEWLLAARAVPPPSETTAATTDAVRRSRSLRLKVHLLVDGDIE
jgi:hypothetical protein